MLKYISLWIFLFGCALFTWAQSPFDRVFDDVNGVSTNELYSLMVVQHDSVLYERYGVGHRADELFSCWSATKTFTATAVGFALQDGLLSLDTPVVRYFSPEELPATISPRLAKLTLDHLLSMSSGFTADGITTRMRGGENFDPVAEVWARGFVDNPGAKWRYNNTDTYIAGVVVEKVTGMPLEEYLQLKLFAPLGITDYYYERDARGHNLGATGLHLSTRSLMKMGLFMLGRGNWEGKQLLRSDWFDRAMAVQIYQGEPQPTDWRSGYCYQMWACRVPGCVRLDGMWGQYVIIMPDKDAVAVMTSLCTKREVQMDSFWKNVYANLPCNTLK